MLLTHPSPSMRNLYRIHSSGRERETFAISLTQKLQCQVLLQNGLDITITLLLGFFFFQETLETLTWFSQTERSNNNNAFQARSQHLENLRSKHFHRFLFHLKIPT